MSRIAAEAPIRQGKMTSAHDFKSGKGDKDEDHGDKEDAADSDKSGSGHHADEETPRRRRRSAE